VNAVRHGLTAETVINALEDTEDYAAFELAVTSDHDAQSAVERELIPRLASLLWRLRRATAIESGLSKLQARQLLRLRQLRKGSQERRKIIDGMYGKAEATEADLRPDRDDSAENIHTESATPVASADQSDNLTHTFLRLTHLPNCLLDRLSRHEAALWRQACQILFALQCLDRRRPWEIMKRRGQQVKR
jgi:hypothetical protein